MVVIGTKSIVTEKLIIIRRVKNSESKASLSHECQREQYATG
jgi:hypothetical protein